MDDFLLILVGMALLIGMGRESGLTGKHTTPPDEER
jgi:hypothetical protein